MIYALASLAVVLLLATALAARLAAKRQREERECKTKSKKWRAAANEVYDALK